MRSPYQAMLRASCSSSQETPEQVELYQASRRDARPGRGVCYRQHANDLIRVDTGTVEWLGGLVVGAVWLTLFRLPRQRPGRQRPVRAFPRRCRGRRAPGGLSGFLCAVGPASLGARHTLPEETTLPHHTERPVETLGQVEASAIANMRTISYESIQGPFAATWSNPPAPPSYHQLYRRP